MEAAFERQRAVAAARAAAAAALFDENEMAIEEDVAAPTPEPLGSGARARSRSGARGLRRRGGDCFCRTCSWRYGRSAKKLRKFVPVQWDTVAGAANTIWGLVPGTSESIRLAAKQHYLNNKQLICAQCGGDKRYSNAGGQGI